MVSNQDCLWDRHLRHFLAIFRQSVLDLNKQTKSRYGRILWPRMVCLPKAAAVWSRIHPFLSFKFASVSFWTDTLTTSSRPEKVIEIIPTHLIQRPTFPIYQIQRQHKALEKQNRLFQFAQFLDCLSILLVNPLRHSLRLSEYQR